MRKNNFDPSLLHDLENLELPGPGREKHAPGPSGTGSGER